MNEQISVILEPFIKLFQQSEQYATWQQAGEVLETNDQAQQLLAKFNQAKEDFAEAQRFGKYHPDYQQYQRNLAQAKMELDHEPVIVAYKQAQKQLQAVLNQMSIALGTAVSPHLIVPSDFFSGKSLAKKSCGTSCKCG